ncbi:hypothetical protein L9F63_012927, partial [Diploptera punctata]
NMLYIRSRSRWVRRRKCNDAEKMIHLLTCSGSSVSSVKRNFDLDNTLIIKMSFRAVKVKESVSKYAFRTFTLRQGET